MSRFPRGPIRTCIGCGARAPQAELLRLGNAADGGVQLVVGRAHAGRSGYLHDNQGCWQRFAARKGLVRSLRRNVEKVQRLAFLEGLKEGRDLSIRD